MRYMRFQKLSKQNDDELTGTENQIQLSINRLFNPPKNRVLTIPQWWSKCMEIDNQILIAIKDGRIPRRFLLRHYVRNRRDHWTKGITPKTDYIRQFQAVSDYLEEQEHQPDDVRLREYASMVEDS